MFVLFFAEDLRLRVSVAINWTYKHMCKAFSKNVKGKVNPFCLGMVGGGNVTDDVHAAQTLCVKGKRRFDELSCDWQNESDATAPYLN